jgi:hypothetical protein
MAKHIFRCHVALQTFLEDFHDFQAWQGHLQTGAFEFV